MVTPVSVSFSGPAFSFLLYENTKCDFQQEGFLLGEIIRKETKTITDNDQQQLNISRTIRINSIMPCPQPQYFYNSVGLIDADKIRDFLGNQLHKVVAWYKYQDTSNFNFTMRDKVVHKQLLKLFEISSELFTCCLLINEASDNGSTHVYSQAFLRCHNNICDRLAIHIPNLSEPNNTYKSSETASDTFNKILSDLKIDRNNTQGLVVINRIQNALQKHIDTVIKDLAESETYLHELEQEVKQLEVMQKLKAMNNVNIKELEFPRLSENNVQSDESSPETRRKSNRTRDVIDSSSSQESQETLPQVHVMVTKGRGGRGRGKRRGSGISKEAREAVDSSRLRKKD